MDLGVGSEMCKAPSNKNFYRSGHSFIQLPNFPYVVPAIVVIRERSGIAFGARTSSWASLKTLLTLCACHESEMASPGTVSHRE